MYAQAQNLAARAVQAGKFFVMIGGDHSTTIPVHRGVDQALNEEFGILHFR